VSDVRDLWVGQNGEKLGPYTGAEIRQWLAEGRFSADALAWRTGMASWEPVLSVLHGEAPPPPPPGERPAAPQPQQRYYAKDNGPPDIAPPGAFSAGQPSAARSNTKLSTPPTLHWGLVFLYSVLTLGVFGMVWPFVQAYWIRSVDRSSKAMLLLGIGTAFYIASVALQSAGLFTSRTDVYGGGHIAELVMAMILVYCILLVVACFSMAGSIRRTMQPYGPSVRFGAITLVFLNAYAIQGHLTWIGRWNQTGQTEPAPPKGKLWLIMLFPIALVVSAGIALFVVSHP
jgi:GYF domain 2